MPKTSKRADKEEFQAQLRLRLKYYPMRVFTYLILAGITSAFLFLSIAYFATTFGTDFNNFKLPLLFHANTIIILASSYSLGQTRKALLRDDWTNYTYGLLVTAGLGIAFTCFQLVAWRELMGNGIKMANSIAGAYVYVISGLHLFHLIMGVAMLLFFSADALGKKDDPVKLLLFESDPFSKMRLSLLCTYWHFVDGLWLYIYLFFVLNIYVLGPR